MISDNNYTSYYDMVKQVLVDAGIDTSDNTVYQESLTDDKFEGVVTVVYPDADAITAVESALQSNMDLFSNPQPIFEEVVTDHYSNQNNIITKGGHRFPFFIPTPSFFVFSFPTFLAIFWLYV